ncbi:NUDIX domain-containing protein [Candidatus Babeliales bacterium]|nr:NUDIX domain-containing protein [Candidatus Babeliales bacterium]
MKHLENLINASDCHDEILDLVDEQDCVVQTMPRLQVYNQNLCSQMRSVWLIIKNQHGQMWIPRRSWNVDRLPGHLDGSVSGHVLAGETYEQALVRETMEEVGLQLQPGSYSFLGKLTPQAHNTFCFASVYEMLVDAAPENWNRHDIADWYWLTPQELMIRCQQGDKFKDTLPVIMHYFYNI